MNAARSAASPTMARTPAVLATARLADGDLNVGLGNDVGEELSVVLQTEEGDHGRVHGPVGGDDQLAMVEGLPDGLHHAVVDGLGPAVQVGPSLAIEVVVDPV